MEFICFINIFYRYGKKLLEKMLDQYGINMQELIVILVISESEGILQSKLINFTGLNKGNFSKFLKDLEIRQYIYRRESSTMPGQNRCYLTEKGQALAPYLRDTLSSWEQAITNNIDQDQVQVFNQVSASISDNLFENLEIRW